MFIINYWMLEKTIETGGHMNLIIEPDKPKLCLFKSQFCFMLPAILSYINIQMIPSVPREQG